MFKLALGVMAVCIGIVVVQAQPPGASGGRGPGGGRGPVGKNLKVLQASEINTYMGMAVTGLGLNPPAGQGCAFCHADGGRELDDKPEKLVARKMMQMVKDVNANSFGGEQKVVCWTCHRGEAKPAAAPAGRGFGGGGRGPGGPPPPPPPPPAPPAQ